MYSGLDEEAMLQLQESPVALAQLEGKEKLHTAGLLSSLSNLGLSSSQLQQLAEMANSNDGGEVPQEELQQTEEGSPRSE